MFIRNLFGPVLFARCPQATGSCVLDAGEGKYEDKPFLCYNSDDLFEEV